MELINNIVDKKISLLSSYITFKLNKKNSFGYIERAKIKYASEVLIYDLFKFVMLMSIFLSIGKMGAFITIYIMLMTTRVQIGGMHMKTFVTCFLYTTFFFVMVIVVAEKIFINIPLICTTILIEIFLFIIKNISEAKRNRNLLIILKPILPFVIFIVLTMVLVQSLMKYIAIALIYHQIEIFCVYLYKLYAREKNIGSSDD